MLSDRPIYGVFVLRCSAARLVAASSAGSPTPAMATVPSKPEPLSDVSDLNLQDKEAGLTNGLADSSDKNDKEAPSPEINSGNYPLSPVRSPLLPFLRHIREPLLFTASTVCTATLSNFLLCQISISLRYIRKHMHQLLYTLVMFI
uniref:Uncharacterized protein n=1 Tax=Aegilops tauschii subsp. strangulata TaxID=200361 RepID=A0A453Q5S9_AEGTS